MGSINNISVVKSHGGKRKTSEWNEDVEMLESGQDQEKNKIMKIELHTCDQTGKLEAIPLMPPRSK